MGESPLLWRMDTEFIEVNWQKMELWSYAEYCFSLQIKNIYEKGTRTAVL